MRIGYGTSVTVPTQTERWFSELRAGRAFCRGQIFSPTVGQFAEVQLFNPVGSGVQLLIYAAILAPSANDAPHLRSYNTALGTLVGTGVNLQLGGTAAHGEVRTASVAALDGTVFGYIYQAALDSKNLGTTWFCELDPGEGFLIANNAVTTSLIGTFFWNEV